jgi:hypothetical protein
MVPFGKGKAVRPLAEWDIVPPLLIYANRADVNGSQFRDLPECQDALDKLRNGRALVHPSHEQSKYAICIEDSDPRFKGNIRFRGIRTPTP